MTNPTPFDVDDIWDRVLDKVDKSDDCWVYAGPLTPGGYGSHKYAGIYYSTHRVAYQALVGDIPKGLELDHLCRVRNCCNPDHLEAVTHAENVLRGESLFADRKRQTHCVHGHEFTEENTRVRPNGTRECWSCKRTQRRARSLGK